MNIQVIPYAKEFQGKDEDGEKRSTKILANKEMHL